MNQKLLNFKILSAPVAKFWQKAFLFIECNCSWNTSTRTINICKGKGKAEQNQRWKTSQHLSLTSKITVVGVRITILVVTIVTLGLRIIINDRSSRDLHCFACDDHIGNRCLLPHTVLSNVAPNNLSTLIFVLALITVKPIIKYLRKFKISEVINIKPIMKCQRSKIYEVD